MSYIESLANNKFEGDIEAAREWLRQNGKKGGKTGEKHLSKLTPAERTKLAKKANQRSQEARKRKEELGGMEYEDLPDFKLKGKKV